MRKKMQKGLTSKIAVAAEGWSRLRTKNAIAGEIKRLRGGLAAGVSVLAVHGTIAHNSRSVSSAAMNRKQKVLTIIALIIFLVIGAGHYLRWPDPHFVLPPVMVPNMRIPWFMLGVIYAGLFFLLADRKEKR